jgi:translation initiation factor 2 subunit 1
VAPEDVAKCEERFNKSKMVHSIMRHVAETTHCDLEELYKTVAWPLYRIFGHAFDALKVMVSDDGGAIFRRLEEDKGTPVDVLTPAVSPVSFIRLMLIRPTLSTFGSYCSGD